MNIFIMLTLDSLPIIEFNFIPVVKYIYVCILGQWEVSLGPFKQAVLTEVHIMQSTIVNDCSGGRT